MSVMEKLFNICGTQYMRITANFRSSPTGRGPNPLKDKKLQKYFEKRPVY